MMDLRTLDDDQLHDLRLDLERYDEADRETEELLWRVIQEQTLRQLEQQETQ